MLALYIIGGIILAIIAISILVSKWSREEKREKYKAWLLDINQWEIGDEVEVGKDGASCYPLDDTSIYYYCVNRNEKYHQNAYHDRAIETYNKRFPAMKKESFVKLVKWDEKDALIEFADGDQVYMSTKFISKNISYMKRKIDKKTETFVLTKKEKMIKLRKDKLIRVLKENSE